MNRTEFFRPIPGNGFWAPLYRLRDTDKVDRFDGAAKLWEPSETEPVQLKDTKLFVPVLSVDEARRIVRGFGV